MPRNENRSDVNVLYTQLQRRMIEYGDWDRISNTLTQKLNESGWLDDLRHQSREMARNGDSVTVESLMSELRPRAGASIPPRVKQEVISMIRQYLEQQLEG